MSELIKFDSTVTGAAGTEELTIETADSEFNDLVSNLASLTTDATATFNANINVGTLSTQIADINCSAITTSGNQTYNEAVQILSDSTLSASSGDISFASAVNTNGNKKLTFVAATNDITFHGTVGSADSPLYAMQITSSGNTVFEESVVIGTFIDKASSGNITFKKGGAITAIDAGILNTEGTVTLGTSTESAGSAPTLTIGSNLKHTAGNTEIYGTLNVPEKDIILETSVIKGSIIGNNITLGETTGVSITITNKGLFKTTDGNSITFTSDFTQNGYGNSALGGRFTGDGDASFETNLLLYGSFPATFGSTGQEINIGENLIISRDNKLSIDATLAIANNLVLYNGDVTVKANISANDDVILFGSSYKTKDDTTGIEDEFAYTTPRHSD